MAAFIRLSSTLAAIAAFACAATITTGNAEQQRNLGLVGIKNQHGTWLQSWSNGQLHLARNRSAEETWFLIAVNRADQIYAFANYRTGNFLSKQAGDVRCVSANAANVSTASEWKIIPGKPSVDAISLRNVADGTLLTAGCSGGTGSRWGRWWDLRTVGKPNGNPGKPSIMGEPVNLHSVPIPVITSL